MRIYLLSAAALAAQLFSPLALSEIITTNPACGNPIISLSSDTPVAKVGQHVIFHASIMAATEPLTFGFDVDGDGKYDNVSVASPTFDVVYPTKYSGPVQVKVVDLYGCTATATTNQIVEAQDMEDTVLDSSETASQICGAGGNEIEPGERWSTHVVLTNNGTQATNNGYAVFTQNLNDPQAAKLTIETPAVSLPSIAPGASAAVDVPFFVSQDATCGAPVEIDYLGTADDNGFTSARGKAVVKTSIKQQCHPQMCSANVYPFAYHQGNYFDPKRPGNGITTALITSGQKSPSVFAAWFTGDDSREPTWFVFSDAINGNQMNATMYSTHQPAEDAYPVTKTPVGSAQLTYIAAEKIIYTWQMGDRSGGATVTPVVEDANSTLRVWYSPNESGWGTFDELIPGAGSDGLPFMFSIAYIYDANGFPRWVTSSSNAYKDGLAMDTYSVHPTCPGCVWSDYRMYASHVGTQLYQSGPKETISTDFTLPYSAGTWFRKNLEIDSLTE